MKKVLIVDDYPDTQNVLRRMVKLLGFVAVVASSGVEALQRAIQERPDPILVDLMMPQMDGWQLTRALRATAETREIPIVAVTATFRDADLQACLEAGCNAYLVKPFTLDELQRKINEVCSHARAV